MRAQPAEIVPKDFSKTFFEWKPLKGAILNTCKIF